MMINIICKMIKIMNRMIDDKYDANEDKDARQIIKMVKT